MIVLLRESQHVLCQHQYIRHEQIFLILLTNSGLTNMVATGQGKVREKFFFSRSGKSQGISVLVRENGTFEKSQGKLTLVREN